MKVRDHHAQICAQTLMFLGMTYIAGLPSVMRYPSGIARGVLLLSGLGATIVGGVAQKLTAREESVCKRCAYVAGAVILYHALTVALDRGLGGDVSISPLETLLIIRYYPLCL